MLARLAIYMRDGRIHRIVSDDPTESIEVIVIDRTPDGDMTTPLVEYVGQEGVEMVYVDQHFPQFDPEELEDATEAWKDSQKK